MKPPRVFPAGGLLISGCVREAPHTLIW